MMHSFKLTLFNAHGKFAEFYSVVVPRIGEKIAPYGHQAYEVADVVYNYLGADWIRPEITILIK